MNPVASTPRQPSPGADSWARVRAPGPVTPALLGVALAFMSLYLALDWMAYFRPFKGLDITPWNPEPALAIALLVRWPRAWWLALASLLASDALVRGWPGGWLASGLGSGLGSGVLVATYALMAQQLRRRLDPALFLSTQQDLLRFMLVLTGGTLAGALAYLSINSGQAGSAMDWLGGVVRHWLGNLVGLIVVLPVLLMLMDRRRRIALRATLSTAQWWLVAASIVLMLWGLGVLDERSQFRYVYLMLLPLGWAATRQGVAGAVLSSILIQVGLLVGMQSAPSADMSLFEIQLRMAIVALAGLSLGLAVDERERLNDRLRGSLRMAAAGQMAAALAHELSQPLTALGQYAQASRLLTDPAAMPDAQRQARLQDVAGRMADEAQRAGVVVKRLREFFRTGGTRLEAVALPALLADALRAHEKRAQALRVRLSIDAEADLPAVQIDRVQIDVVLRNLLDNALDATSSERGLAGGQVTVRAERQGGLVKIEVRDSGPGIAPARLEGLFEAGTSDKPGGMGIGLSICRAIVEAHGGRLWAEPGAPGRLCFTLEAHSSEDTGAPHAS
jgi:signal transduction histidine kinase